MFQDLVMAGLGVCTLDDIATAVVATVIGHQKGKGWIITDAGWMAMSRDRGTASQPVDQGYGIVTSMDDVPYDDLIMSATSQEHGILTMRKGSDAPLPDLPVGTQVKIYPNHACATAAQFDEYVVMDGGEMRGTWARFRGW
jgi:D-serine deaminase-like pyridoxal phosphate-dependent protein